MTSFGDNKVSTGASTTYIYNIQITCEGSTGSTQIDVFVLHVLSQYDKYQ